MTRIVVTGAAGFLGEAVLAALAARGGDFSIRGIDRVAAKAPDNRFTAVVADLGEPGSMPDLVGDADIVMHLAAMPGGAAEADPAGSRRINLDAPLALIAHLAARPDRPRLVLASSIAVFGTPLPAAIDDDTLPLPTLTYGAHKLMAEIALADATRREQVEGVALRLPGLVARPGAGTGLRSAFLTELFHAAAGGRLYTVPVSRDATVWIMSVRQAAANLVHAAFATAPCGSRVAMTLPAIRTAVGELADALIRHTGSRGAVDHAPDPELEAQFGALPPLRADQACDCGYRSDVDLATLIETTLADLRAAGRADA